MSGVTAHLALSTKYWVVASTLALLACQGCKSGGQAPSPPTALLPAEAARAPARVAPLADAPASCATKIVKQTNCTFGGLNEGTTRINLLEGEPPRETTTSPEPYAADFVVAGRTVHEPSSATRSIALSGRTKTAEYALLNFLVEPGWSVAAEPGATLRYQSLLQELDCPGATAASPEPTVLSAASLRNPAGALLLLAVADVPLARGGNVMLPANMAAEINVSWRDIACPVYLVGSGTSSGKRPVALVVRLNATGEEFWVTYGRRLTLQWGQESYVIAVNQAWVPESGQECGRATWALYRQGFLFAEPPPSAPPASP